MGYKKLISPEFRVTVGDYEVTDGIEVECFSSKESHMDWCRVELSPQLQGVLKFKDMDEASVELGYEDDFDSLIDGYVRCGDTDYWKEIMIKDDMMKLDRVTIKASFVDCEPQDVIRYVLACAGIEDYVLSDEHYGKKDLSMRMRKGMQAMGGACLTLYRESMMTSHRWKYSSVSVPRCPKGTILMPEAYRQR